MVQTLLFPRGEPSLSGSRYSDGETEGRLTEIRDLWRREPFRTFILLGLIILAVLTFRTALILILRTEYPLETPISGSMEPTLRIGDLLVVQGGLNPEDIKAEPDTGDIIVFRKPGNPGEFVVHRAIRKFQKGDRYYFITKGDNNARPDNWVVPEENIIGKVVWVIPMLGYVKIYLGTPLGMAVGVILIATLLILEALPSRGDEGEEPSQDKPDNDLQG
ncbi:MAG: S26B, signal peptidase I [Candidatus Bathyarchaeota archaeon B26-2]|nr:MAG: S26B, signal peptidase I [Candidatus Bathyarchaeota archaeon B26-2]